MKWCWSCNASKQWKSRRKYIIQLLLNSDYTDQKHLLPQLLLSHIILCSTAHEQNASYIHQSEFLPRSIPQIQLSRIHRFHSFHPLSFWILLNFIHFQILPNEASVWPRCLRPNEETSKINPVPSQFNTALFIPSVNIWFLRGAEVSIMYST